MASPALAALDTASVVLAPLQATTTQGLPNTPLGLFTFDLHAALNTVNNDPGSEAVYNLQASASSQYTTQYYACAPRGGGCSTVPTTITAQQNAAAVSSQTFIPGEMALGQFTFSYNGILSFSVAAQNAPIGDSYSLALLDATGAAVALGSSLNGTYTLNLKDNGFASAADYVISTSPSGATTGTGSGGSGSGGTAGSGGTGGSGGSAGSGGTTGSGGSAGSGSSGSGSSGSDANSPGVPVPEPESLLLLGASLLFAVGAHHHGISTRTRMRKS